MPNGTPKFWTSVTGGCWCFSSTAEKRGKERKVPNSEAWTLVGVECSTLKCPVHGYVWVRRYAGGVCLLLLVVIITKGGIIQLKPWEIQFKRTANNFDSFTSKSLYPGVRHFSMHKWTKLKPIVPLSGPTTVPNWLDMLTQPVNYSTQEIIFSGGGGRGRDRKDDAHTFFMRDGDLWAPTSLCLMINSASPFVPRYSFDAPFFAFLSYSLNVWLHYNLEGSTASLNRIIKCKNILFQHIVLSKVTDRQLALTPVLELLSAKQMVIILSHT